MNPLYQQLLNDYILPALAAAIVGGAVSLWNMLRKWVQAHVSVQNQLLLEAIVSEGVRGAEQLWSNPGVRDVLTSKRDEAFDYINARLKAAKVPVSAEQVWFAIEAEVLKLKSNGEEIKAAPTS